MLYDHVKAHSGHPWNECADVLADHGGSGGAPSQNWDLPLAPWLQHGVAEAQWAWVEQATAEDKRALPAMQEGVAVFGPPRSF